MSDNIKVVVKVRPLISREIDDKLSHQWRVGNNTLSQIESGREYVNFTFDKVYDESSKTTEVYNDVAKPIVEAAIAGFNGTIFAYGQTSSGKTYTMTGTDSSQGIIPLAINDLFEFIKNKPDRDFLVRVSYMEIYNETVRDLLDIDKKDIKILPQRDTVSGVKVDVQEKVTATAEEVFDVMRLGNVNRQTGSTNMNEESSRSHSIFQIIIESREHIEGEEESGSVNVSQLNLVDLAGSERAGQTGATGIRFKEGTHINKSLSSLALVIKQLSEDEKGSSFINYRNSKLTRILQNSLGGNAKTCIICAVTPAAVEETISTLQFANRAKAIKNKPLVNEVATHATMIQRLTKKLSSLQTQLQSKLNVEQDNVNLQKQIAGLRRLILTGLAKPAPAGRLARKLPPRRATISALQSLPEDPLPSVPKFCTPSLKYNPLSLPGAPTVSQSAGLCTVPEEVRAITPPLKHVSFGDDVIEIDSDDDEEGSQKCSPYHKCYDSSKTPPCILRKHAKHAKKSLNDLVELTEREKIYSPDIIELMEKLEQKCSDISKLQEEVNYLHTSAKEKDSRIQELKEEINKAEEDIKTLNNDKVTLETRCKEQDSRLTDCEVSYETLKIKAKTREKELLSLLDEQTVKKAEDIGKTKNKTIDHFMDMSKDISLVNSDNENSICPPEDETPSPLNELVKDLQSQINSKIQLIKDLEASISTQKQTIDSLEINSQELHQTISNLQDGLALKENENDILKSSVDTLNTTITKLKDNLDTANRDIESYNNVVQELQIKLANRENILNVNINDSFLEDMISNEQKLIANNENINNIVILFKMALGNRNKEISDLNSKLATYNALETNKCKIEEELLCKEKIINDLREKFEVLMSKYDANLITINKLELERNNYKLAEQDLIVQLSNLKEENNKLNDFAEELNGQIRELKENYDKLTAMLSEKENEHLNILKKSEELKAETKRLSENIVKLQEEIDLKDNIIASLNNEDQKSQEYISTAKSAIIKLQDILKVMNSESVFSENVEELVVQANTLQDRLNILEIAANKVMSEKEEVVKYNLALKKEFADFVEKHNSEIDLFNSQIESYISMKIRIADELLEVKNNLNEKSTVNENLRRELIETKELYEIELSTLKIVNEEYKNKELETIKEIESFTDNIESLELTLKTKENEILQLQKSITEKKEKLISLHETNSKMGVQIDSILQRVSQVHCRTNTNLTLQCRGDAFQLIIEMLDDIDNILLNSENSDSTQSDDSKNLELQHDSKQTLNELESIKDEDNKIKLDLKTTNELLSTLRSELETKTIEIQSMEVKVQNWKEQFINLDQTMKQQMDELIKENESLKKTMQSNVDKVDVFDESSSGSSTRPTRKSMSMLKKVVETYSPRSLCSISFEKVLDVFENNIVTNSNSSSDMTAERSEVETQCCCYELTLQLKSSQQQISDQSNYILKLNSENNHLMEEQDVIRNEVKLLLEPANELQKKIVNHRTNLSTLTATTYAENKLLKSQATALQHHHNRFHNVCQRDIPAFKKQLLELMTILKDPSFSDKHDASFKRYSLPDVLDTNTTLTQYKNESTLDGDLLMLDTNVTLATIDNTLTGYDQTCLDITQTYMNNDVTNDLSQTSEFKVNNSVKDSHLMIGECEKCVEFNTLEHKFQVLVDSLTEEANVLKAKLCEVETQRKEMEEKYNNLTLEVPSIENLVKKISILEKDYNDKLHEIKRLTELINIKNKEYLAIQDENDSLSNQVMDNISEFDNLKKEFDALKESNALLSEEYLLLKNKTDICKCTKLPSTDTHSVLNRSLSDSDTTTRYNKLCTLQSELLAGREDCKELTQEVATIKNHLERSNISTSEIMDLDDSKGDSNNFSFTNLNLNQSKLCKMPDIPEENVYSLEKQQCLAYYLEKAGVDENLDPDMKMIEIMKSFYDNLLAKHGNEVENLTNKLHDYEDLISELKTQFDNMSTKYSKVAKELEENINSTEPIINTMSQVIHNFSLLNEEAKNINNSEDCDSTKLLEMFKENVLNVLDSQLGLSSVSVFKIIIDSIINKHQNDLKESMEKYTKLHEHMENISKELSNVNDNLNHQKSQLLVKEHEYNLLNAQKEAVHEISKAVTLDIIKKENELKEILSIGYQRLVHNNIINQEEVDLTLSPLQCVDKLFESLQNKHNSLTEINKYKTSLEEKEKELTSLRIQNENTQQVNNKMTVDLTEKENVLQEHKRLYEDLSKVYETKLEENKTMSNLINNLTEEVELLKLSLLEKEATIQSLEDNITSYQNKESSENITDFVEKVNSLEEALSNMRSINKVLTSEKDEYAAQLEKCGETIKQNNEELQRMTSEILILRESVNENTLVLDNVKTKADALYKETVKLKEELAEKCRDCSRLEINIKTHEKTAEIQSKMIIRLQKQKDDMDIVIGEKDKKLEDITQKYKDLQEELDRVRKNVETANEEALLLKNTKHALEERVSKLETDLRKQKEKDIPNADKNEFEEYCAETVFGARGRPDDLFMDVDDEASDRSTPIRLSRGRDSFASRMDHSSSVEPHSRPSSVQATRRRRQSLHDALRTTLQDTSNDRSKHLDDLNNKSAETSGTSDNEVSRLKERLGNCERELEEMKESYRALDEECEICATYLREREQQLSQVKKEKKALEQELSELKSQKSETVAKVQRNVAHASVNTDEDWANLHSVVVDRMSYDAEVEKNKRLTKTIEELRFKKQDLKNTVDKMQKALEKSSCNRELEATKSELRSCKQELSELRDRYKELDEECETCAMYLREKDEQLRRLRDAKIALEAKLCEYNSGVSRSRRRAAHDASRGAGPPGPPGHPGPPGGYHVAVQTTDDLLTHYVERDNNSQRENEVKRLKMNVEKLSAQKAALEQQLANSAQQPTMYVAAGSAIVQNQQLSDIMKENHKLKKINAKLVDICKRRGKPLAESNRGTENNVENVG